jgi:hypothetical protein
MARTKIKYRGKSNERGVGFLFVRDFFSLPQEIQKEIINFIDAMEKEASLTTLIRRRVDEATRAVSNRIAKIARGIILAGGVRFIDPIRGVAGHLPDVASGADPHGPISNLNKIINSSIGGQWKRYEYGFIFDGFTLYDIKSGKWIYASGALEHEPRPLKPGTDPSKTNFDILNSLPNRELPNQTHTKIGSESDRLISLSGSPYTQISNIMNRNISNKISKKLGLPPYPKWRSLFIHNYYAMKILGHKPTEAVFKTPWSASRGLGTRRFDHWDKATGKGFEFNTTPWSRMTRKQLSRKLDQVGSDYTLLKSNPLVKMIIWVGSEPLPSFGLGGQLSKALRMSGIKYYHVPLPSNI